MFNTIIDKYNNSKKTKEDKLNCFHDIYNNMLNFKQLTSFITNNSVIDSFHVTKSGTFIQLNDSRGKTKFFINENAFAEVPIQVMGTGDYENIETDTALSIINDIMNDSFVMFDIGANIGWYSAIISNLHKNAKIYSFEPAPITFIRLKNNIMLNGHSTDRLFNIGLYSEKSKLEFFYNNERPGASSFRNLFDTNNCQKIMIDVEVIDDFVDKHNIINIDYIKCDVEGAEFFVLKGGVHTITKSKPVIFLEMLRKWSAKFNYSPNDIIEFLSSIGYSCFSISGNKQLTYCPKVTEQTIETNYYFLHNEKHKSLIKKYAIMYNE